MPIVDSVRPGRRPISTDTDVSTMPHITAQNAKIAWMENATPNQTYTESSKSAFFWFILRLTSKSGRTVVIKAIFTHCDMPVSTSPTNIEGTKAVNKSKKKRVSNT